MGNTRARRKPAAARSARISGSVRSRPPQAISISRSRSLPKSGVLPGWITDSTSRSLPPPAMARRMFLRRRTASSSLQSWMMADRMYASAPPGTEQKKSPPISSQRAATPARSRFACAPRTTWG
ncbi:hypothetical protein WME94_54070 [Sorangium sp. So ce429]